MKKFSALNEIHDSVVKSTTIDEVITNLVKETLSINVNESVETTNNVNKLVESIKYLIELQKSKKAVEVLENVRFHSIRNLNLNWLNDVIDQEKQVFEDLKVTPKKADDIKKEIETSIINEALTENTEESVCPDCNEKECICDNDTKKKTEEIENTKDTTNEEHTETIADAETVVEEVENDDDLEEDDLDEYKDKEEEEGEEFNDGGIFEFNEYVEESKDEEDEDLTEDDTFIDVKEDEEDEDEEDEEDEFEDNIEDYKNPEEEEKEEVAENTKFKRSSILKFDDFKA
jgi:hypothetical protein